MRFFVLFFILVSSLYSHKLNLFVETKGNELSLQSYFASGQGCHECEVMVKKENKIEVQSKTNENGEFKTTLSAGTYEVSVEATGGHKATENIAIKTKPLDNASKKEVQQDDLKLSGLIQNIVALLGLVVIILVLKRIKS